MYLRGSISSPMSPARIDRILILAVAVVVAAMGVVLLSGCGSDDSFAEDDSAYSGFYVYVDGFSTHFYIPDAEALENRTVSMGSGYAAFNGNPASFTIPSTVTSPDSGIVYTVTAIADKAFFNEYSTKGNLQSVSIPDTVTSIGSMAFRDTGLTSVTIPANVEYIANDAFYNCPLTEYAVDDGNVHFSTHDGLLLGEGGTVVIAVPAGATGDCIIPEGVERIGRMAFTGCNYSSVSIPEGVVRIENNAFSYSRQLTRLHLPASATSIASNIAYMCPKLASITVDDGNPNYSSDGKALLSRDGTVLHWILDRVTGVYETPASVTTIDNNAFMDSRLHTLIISDSVVTIGYDILLQNHISAVSVPGTITPADGGFSYLYRVDGTLIGYDAAEQADALGHSFVRIDNKLTMVPDDHPSRSISYDIAGGTGSEPVQADVMDGFAFEAKPFAGTKTGHLFSGWSSGEREFEAGDPVIVNGADVVLVAIWAPISYTVSFDANGGEGSIDDQAHVYGTPLALTANGFNRVGYGFGGWNTAIDGTWAGYADGETVSDLSATADSTVVLYAQWDPISYGITYNLNGGSNSASNPSAYDIEDEAISFASPSKTGYDFLGWFSDEECETSKPSIPSGSTGEVTVYAKWSPTAYAISYNLYGGENGESNPSTYTIESEDIILAPASRTGYVFGGWFSEEVFVTEVESIPSESTGVRSLFAKWSPISYGITYHLNGGSNSGSNPSAYDIEDEDISFASPSKTGYDFLGWFSDAGFSTAKPSIPTGSTGAVEVHAKWAPSVYGISYNLYGGENGESNPSTYTIESEAIVLAPASRTGYDFLGWFSEAGFANRVEVIASGSHGDVTVHAKWAPIQYAIGYMVAGGDKGSNPSTYTIESPEIVFAPAARTGYVFGGWYSDAGAIISKTRIESGSHGDVTVHAKWTPITYTVAFDANTGSGSMQSLVLTYGIAADLPANAFSKPGNVFVRWALAADGAGAAYADGASVSDLTSVADSTVTLYAIWADRTYEVAFDSMGGSEVDIAVVGHGMTVVEPVSSRTGYAVAGWFTDEGCESEWDFETDVVVSGLTLYAKWAPITYSVAFDGNGGAGSMAVLPMTYGSPSNLPSCTFTRSGYSFDGWSASADGSGTAYEDGASVSDLTSVADFSVVLYAQWDAISYPITYANMDGAVNNASNPSDYDIEDSAIAFAPPTKIGYAFDRWYADAGLSTPKASISSGSTGSVTVYAGWTPVTYTVTYHPNDGVNGSNPSGYTIESADIVLEPATRHGYDFLGWYAEAGFATEVEIIASGSTGDLDLFARWAPARYAIEYVVAGGDKGANPATYTIESPAIAFAPATRNGYDFGGWYSDEGLENGIEGIEAGSTGSVTIHAKWSPATYTISYHLNEGVNGSNPSGYTIESAEIVLADASKTGYVFGGWYSEAGFTNRVDRIATGSTGNAELFAKWNPVTYPVVFDANGGAGEMDDQMHTYDSPIALTSNVFSREGYTFAGWNTVADGTGTAYADGASASNLASTSGAEVVLHAQWDVVEYTITYHLNGGENSESNPSTYDVEDEDIVLSNATRVNYIFNGWHSDEGSSSRVIRIAAGSTGDIELYARWNLERYSITYNLDGGTNGEGNPSSYTHLESDITLRSASKEGYDFVAWHMNSMAGDPIGIINVSLGYTYNLYAEWSPTPYRITYGNMDGAVNSASNPATYTIEDEAISFEPASKAGYSFGGWYSDEAFESEAVPIPAGSMGEVSIYAKWTLIEYGIGYVLNGGANGENPESYTVESGAMVLEPASKTGYDFLGWFSEAEFVTEVETIASGSTGNLQLHARFAPTEYVITYHLNGGDDSASNPATYTIEDEAISFSPASREGFAFGGWYSDESLTASSEGVPSGSTGAVAVYARWISVDVGEDFATLEAADGGDEVSIGSEAAESVSSKDVTVSAPSWKMEIPSEASTALFDADVSISISEADEASLSDEVREAAAGRAVFSLGISKGGEPFTGDFGAPVKVTVKYTPSDGEDTSRMMVVCINADGTLGDGFSARYFVEEGQGYLEFSVPHFSYWMVSEAPEEPGSSDGGSVVPIVIGAIVAIAAIAGAAFFIIRRRNAQ